MSEDGGEKFDKKFGSDQLWFFTREKSIQQSPGY